MDEVIHSIRAAVRQSNWHAALALALTLPDTCASAAGAKQGRSRYVDWCTTYLVPRYQSNVGPMSTLVTFLSGDDCYALRCAFLHSGDFEIDDPKARATVSRFHFTVARTQGYMVHRNLFGDALQLQVDIFCEDMCCAVEQWLRDVAGDSGVQGRLATLARIHFL